MRRLLNTLYVTNPAHYVARDGENILLLQDDEIKFRIPAVQLEQVVCMNYTGASPAVMKLCVDNNIALVFLNEYGRFLARVTGPVKGNIQLRRQQFLITEDEQQCVPVARNVIAGKIENCRQVLMRGLRDHRQKIAAAEVENAATELRRSYEQVLKAENLQVIRGIEGAAAVNYFQALDHLILEDKDHFAMRSRNRRPPMDRFNALLSFLYTLLVSDITAALETVGLDPAAGFLHRDRSGRNSLALDLMEELRPYMADRLALSMINRRQMSAKDFEIKESGAVLMREDARKELLTAWQKRKQEVTTHPYLNEKFEIGLIPYAQALLLARYLRGDIDGYPPFLWR